MSQVPLPIAGGHEVRIPISGRVLEIRVSPGDRVTLGDILFIFEAMKMENQVRAKVDGVVHSLNIVPGKRVRENELCLIIKT